MPNLLENYCYRSWELSKQGTARLVYTPCQTNYDCAMSIASFPLTAIVLFGIVLPVEIYQVIRDYTNNIICSDYYEKFNEKFNCDLAERYRLRQEEQQNIQQEEWREWRERRERIESLDRSKDAFKKQLALEMKDDVDLEEQFCAVENFFMMSDATLDQSEREQIAKAMIKMPAKDDFEEIEHYIPPISECLKFNSSTGLPGATLSDEPLGAELAGRDESTEDAPL